MNAAVMMQSCPGEETLAAFIDQRLDPASRLEVVKHLAECGDCRDMIVAANEYQSAEGVERKVAAGTFGPRMWVPLAAAAALVGVLFGVPSIRERVLGDREMAKLVEAANALPERTTAARLSGDFEYRGHTVFRNVDEKPVSVAALIVEGAAAEAAERAAKNPTADNLHEAGVGSILAKKADDAVKDLERAVQQNPSSANIRNDLAAAYIARGRDDDYDLALATAKKAFAIQETPAAAWNIALALEYQHRDAEASAAWKRYLELDPNSEWASEVKTKHLSNLLSR